MKKVIKFEYTIQKTDEEITSQYGLLAENDENLLLIDTYEYFVNEYKKILQEKESLENIIDIIDKIDNANDIDEKYKLLKVLKLNRKIDINKYRKSINNAYELCLNYSSQISNQLSGWKKSIIDNNISIDEVKKEKRDIKQNIRILQTKKRYRIKKERELIEKTMIVLNEYKALLIVHGYINYLYCYIDFLNKRLDYLTSSD